jgi:hypothetical protein
MDNAITWKLMLKEKTFIASLYSASNLLAKKILLNANDWQLRVTIQILHLIASNIIEISPEAAKAIEKSKKAKYIKSTFLHKIKVKKLFKLDKASKVALLSKLTSLYPFLLHRIFNQNTE